MSGMVLNQEYSTNLPSSENLSMFHPILSEFRRLLFCFDLAESNPIFPFVNAKPKNEHMILNTFFRPLHIFPLLLGHQEALPKHLHHSWSQSIHFPENWHICLKRGQVISGAIFRLFMFRIIFSFSDTSRSNCRVYFT